MDTQPDNVTPDSPDGLQNRREDAEPSVIRLLERLNNSMDILVRQNREMLSLIESRGGELFRKNGPRFQTTEVEPPTSIALSDPPPTIKAWACDMERYLMFYGYSVEQSLLVIPSYMRICYKIWFYDYCKENTPVTIQQIVSDIVKVIYENVIDGEV
ncbi:hypothetical protein F4703DRAFT_1793105 [Phycomyces blakesleeanus]